MLQSFRDDNCIMNLKKINVTKVTKIRSMRIKL